MHFDCMVGLNMKYRLLIVDCTMYTMYIYACAVTPAQLGRGLDLFMPHSSLLTF